MVSKVRQISEGAMMVAIIAVIMIINRQTANVLEDLIYWLISLPIIIYTVRYGVKASTLVCVSSIFISIMFAGITTLFYLFSALIIGILYGFGMRQKWKNITLLTLTIILHLITTLITVLVLSQIFGYNIFNEFSEIYEVVQQAGSLGNSKDITITFIFIIYVGASVLQAIILHVVAHGIVERLQLDVIPLKPISEVVIPKGVAYFVVGGWLLYMMSSLGIINTSFEPYILAIYTIAFCIGVGNGMITLLTFAMQKKNHLLIFLSMIVCFIPPINNLVLWIGIYDMFTGFHQTLGSG